MQFVTVTLGLMAALASAHGAPRHPHFVYRRQNTTASVIAQEPGASGSGIAGTGALTTGGSSPQLTTMTVITTSVRTVISCAPTITDCPAATNTAAVSALPSDAISTVLVTDTIVLTETVCPVTEASSISSSIISKASTGGIVGSTLTAPTAGATPDTPSETVLTSETEVASSIVATMTLGGGEGGSGREVTTTIVTHVKSTVTITSTLKSPQATGGGSEAGSGSEGGSGEDTTADSTTTGTKTMTGTKTVTVQRPGSTEVGSSPESGSGGSGGSGSGSGSEGGSGSCDCAAAPVTVTLPAETIYVTMTAAPADASPTFPVAGGAAKPSVTDVGSSPEETESACPPEQVVTATVVPFPAGNGTHAGPTGTGTGAAAPTGLLRRFKTGKLVY